MKGLIVKKACGINNSQLYGLTKCPENWKQMQV
jgi:hypothetical protein